MAGLSALGGAALAGAAQPVDFDQLKSKYRQFSFPQAEVILGGAPFRGTNGEVIHEIRVELTSGFEASIARFRIFQVYDSKTGQFRFDDLKKSVQLGTGMEIKLGYLGALETVFVGFIASLNFGYDGVDLPYVEVTGMDIKGIMMSSRYAAQLSSTSYSDAVSEILRRTTYSKLESAQGLTQIKVSATPDKQAAGVGGTGAASAKTIEMVGESDYEFILKVAKRFNFEFFTDRGTVYFRPAKEDSSTLMKLSVGRGMLEFDIGYSLTGLVGAVEARTVDAGNGKLIQAKSKAGDTISTGSKAKGLIKGSKKVYIDPTITSQAEADARAAFLMEEMRYRLGALECTCQGLPELVPGRFVEVENLGVPVDNKFYLTNVVHDFTQENGYHTILSGKAAEVRTSAASLPL